MVDVTGIEVQLRAARQASSDADRLERSLDKLGRQGTKTEGAFERIRRESSKVGSAFDRLKNSIFSIEGAFKALALGAFVRSVGNSALAAESLTNSLRFATGSAEGAADAIKFVREESDRLGLVAISTAKSFSGIAAAAQGTALEGQAVREIFLGVAEASAALGLSADDSEGALRALGQMISKGTVQAEELRGQLGERVPGAFQIASRAMGVTTAQLGKMLEQGQVISADFLPKFAAEMRRAFGGVAVDASTGLRASINRLVNAYDELLRTLSETGVIDAATQIITNLGNIIFNVSTLFTRAKTAVIEFFDQFSDAPQTLTGTAAKLETLSQKILRLSEQRAVSPFPEQLDEHIAELRAEYDKLQKEYLKTSDAQSDLTLEITNGFQPVNVLSSGIDKLSTSAKKATRELTDLEKSQSRFDEAIRQYPGKQIVRELEDQFKAQEEATEATQRFTEQADPMTEAFESAFRRLDDAAANMWQSFFEGGKSALDNIKSFVTRTLSEIAHALTTKRLVMSITGAVGIGGSTVAAAGTGGGFGGGFNPTSLFGGAPGFGPERISAMGLPTGLSNVLASSSFATNPLASGIGGFAGNLGANAIFGGNRGAGAGIGGTLGSIAGSFLPIPIPGVGTAIGGFLGNAVGGLFGGGKSDMAQGGVLNLATGSRDLAGQTGKKFSEENATARTAVLDQAQQFSQTLAQIAGEAIQGSINIVIGSRDGLRLKTEGTVRNFGDDMDALLGGVFDSIVKQSGIFSSHLENMIANFRGSNEQLAQFATSLAAIQRYTKTDPFADFTEAMLSGTRTLYQQALVSRRGLIDLARSFDGSLDAANELANATQQRYQIELQLLQQIDSVARGISSSFADTKEQIIQATLSQEQLYDRLSTRAEDLARQMQTAIDPQIIGELAAQINTLTGRAFGLLGEEQKQSSQAGFLDFLSGIENLAGQRLDMSRQSIAVDRDAGLSGTVASELSKVISGFGAQQQRLQTEWERAAIAQREAAEASRRAAEAQERAALARESYYSGMGGR